MFTFFVIFVVALFALLGVQRLDVECATTPQPRRVKPLAHRPAKPDLKGIVSASH